jgi:hypothetical protein
VHEYTVLTTNGRYDKSISDVPIYFDLKKPDLQFAMAKPSIALEMKKPNIEMVMI